MNRVRAMPHLNTNNEAELLRQNAYHEAGHAVAIYLRNKQYQLPQTSFHIAMFSSGNSSPELKYAAKVEGGRLIKHFLIALEFLQKPEQFAYLSAFEADIINLLAGPLTQAKYVALRDDECFNPHLVNLQALVAYGGIEELETVSEYLQSFIEDKQLRGEKAQQLFLDAYGFIDNRAHWKIISALANYIIQASRQDIPRIPYEKVVDIIETALIHFPVMHPFTNSVRPRLQARFYS